MDKSVQRSPEMGQATAQYLDALDGLLDADAVACYYGLMGKWSDTWGSWGALEGPEDDTPKWDALARHLRPDTPTDSAQVARAALGSALEALNSAASSLGKVADAIQNAMNALGREAQP